MKDKDLKSSPDGPIVEPFVNVKTAARFLHVPENTLYKMALARTVPSFKVGKLRRFRISELVGVMEAHKVDAD